MNRVLVLGSPRVERDGNAVQIERRKAMAMLAYLVVNGQPFTRETLATLFWADYEQSKAYAYLRNTLWTLNKALGDSWAVLDGETVAVSESLDSDIREFREKVAACSPGDPRRNAELLSQAVALVRGDLLAGFTLPDTPAFDDWLFYEQEQMRGQFAGVLQLLVATLISLGQYDTAITHTRRWLSLDTLNESAHRQLMQLYAWTGQHAAAIRQYREAARVLESELGAEPEPETVQLFEAIQARRLTPPVPAATLEPPAPEPIQPTRSQPPAREEGVELKSNLPAQTTVFVGRTEELSEIARLLADPHCRLLTLVGQGGIGKTRLALQAAAQYPDPAFFVSLSPLLDEEFIVPTIAAALRLPLSIREETQKHVLEFLRSKSVLLVMDNFEHLLSSAEILSTILENAPHVKILVTSRERLQLREEWIYELPTLNYPRPGDSLNGSADRFGAVELFVQSARRVRPDFTITDPASVARICQLVEGLPLAIELAATWVQILSTAEIADEIQNCLDFLTTSMRNIPERHRSLRAVFQASWTQLNEAEQACINQLSVFHGGFRQDAAWEIAGASLHLLLALVGKSLIRRNNAGRYEMHELLRQYAEQKLGDRTEVLARHTRYYMSFLTQRNAMLKDARSPAALTEIDQEIDNIRVAWYNATAARDASLLLSAYEPLTHYYIARNRYRECSDMMQRVVDEFAASGESADESASSTSESTTILAVALSILAYCFVFISRYADRETYADRAFALLNALPDSKHKAFALLLLGTVWGLPYESADRAEQVTKQALSLLRSYNDNWGMAMALYTLGSIAHAHIRYDEARQYLADSLAIYRKTGQQWGIAVTLTELAENEFTVGNNDLAKSYYTESLGLFDEIGDQLRRAWVQGWILFNDNQGKDYEHQIQKLHENLAVFEQFGDREATGWMNYHIGWSHLSFKNYNAAIEYFRKALLIFQEFKVISGESWIFIAQSMTYFAAGNLLESIRNAEEALRLVDEANYPWQVSGALYSMGEAELALGRVDSARVKIRQAFDIAYRVQSTTQIVRHLCGLCALLIHDEEPERAAVVLFWVKQHPSTSTDILNRITDLEGVLLTMLPPDVLHHAERAAAAQSLESIVQIVAP